MNIHIIINIAAVVIFGIYLVIDDRIRYKKKCEKYNKSGGRQQ